MKKSFILFTLFLGYSSLLAVQVQAEQCAGSTANTPSDTCCLGKLVNDICSIGGAKCSTWVGGQPVGPSRCTCFGGTDVPRTCATVVANKYWAVQCGFSAGQTPKIITKINYFAGETMDQVKPRAVAACLPYKQDLITRLCLNHYPLLYTYTVDADLQPYTAGYDTVHYSEPGRCAKPQQIIIAD